MHIFFHQELSPAVEDACYATKGIELFDTHPIIIHHHFRVYMCVALLFLGQFFQKYSLLYKMHFNLVSQIYFLN